MTRKFKFIICFILVFAMVPIYSASAQVTIEDRGEAGIHIDDIVYYMSQNSGVADISSLLNQIDQDFNVEAGVQSPFSANFSNSSFMTYGYKGLESFVYSSIPKFRLTEGAA